MKVYLALTPTERAEWRPALNAALPEMEESPPSEAEAVLYTPNSGWQDFTLFPRARVIQSLWAGVERVVDNPTLTQPLCRMVDPSLRQGMVEWCLGWVMRHHLGMDRLAQDGQWRAHLVPPLADERRISILGAGELGAAVGRALSAVGFKVMVWSPSGRHVRDLAVTDHLGKVLARADILVTLLPDTAGTRGLLNDERLSLLPQGAVILNAGRGTVIGEQALLAALDRNVAAAVLDVFVHEPLPPDHPFWAHPRVTVTPHIAAATRPETAAQVVAENLRRAMAGRPLLYQVDRARGY